MFSILGLINTWIGYINMNVKIKNRVYTVVGGIGNFYLLYVAWRFFANGFIGRGLLFILAFLVLLYFTYLNAIYWFTEKKAKWDISPKIENALGIKPKDPEEEARKKVARMRQAGFVQTNGIFDENQDFLPAEITTSEAELANIQIVADSLKKINYLHLDYDGKSKNTIFKEIKSDGKVRYALGETPQALPYFELKNVEGKLVIYGGINQIESYQLGTVKTIGLMPASEAAKKYHIYLATVVLTGGPFMIAGRSTAMEDNEPFRIDAKIAYTSREKKAAPKVDSSYYERTSSIEDEHLSRRRDRRR
ncbi:DUF6681 family protein [Ligilactobacillus salivarius]|uniref:Uncharacterized protein n=3 Tax=Ligilactobacillus salivarius TaxID=1624 RepID=A0A2A2X216_9LACO|nr:DUF6681 family protein [Ligilactobacillus salivarius]HBU67676.1 hypothetical protein [Lactobacillus sp.]ABE00252.1 Hypothetical membrane spanning protein [Ligilactobacillus salivarius UCC118]ADJ79458.1 Hypothetical membrane spanning protein [Ligilactobacillus salivarius CECT 5713]MDE1498601.1 hypothetical protein [Ligilactobacillus salivarius]MDE1500434.1 hypothetical protein [Ligilactobacillus salivarius]